MRKVLCIIACLSAVCALSAQTRLKVMSYNIRFGSASEKKPEYEWKNRKAATPALIEDIAPDIMGLNEPEWDQHEFILRSCRDYAGYDIPRDPGSKEKESEPIYWNRKKIKPLKLGVFWMSETPDVPSRSWGARHYDLATWAFSSSPPPQKPACSSPLRNTASSAVWGPPWPKPCAKPARCRSFALVWKTSSTPPALRSKC